MESQEREGTFAPVWKSGDGKWEFEVPMDDNSLRTITAHMGNCVGGEQHIDIYKQNTGFRGADTRDAFLFAVRSIGKQTYDVERGKGKKKTMVKETYEDGQIVALIGLKDRTGYTNSAGRYVDQIEGSVKHNRRKVSKASPYARAITEFIAIANINKPNWAPQGIGQDNDYPVDPYSPLLNLGELPTGRGFLQWDQLREGDTVSRGYTIQIAQDWYSPEKRQQLVRLIEIVDGDWDLSGAPSDFKKNLTHTSGRIVDTQHAPGDYIVLSRAGGLDIKSEYDVTLPRLSYIGTKGTRIVAKEGVFLAVLESAGSDISASSHGRVSFPKLRRSPSEIGITAPKIDLPLLTTARKINCFVGLPSESWREREKPTGSLRLSRLSSVQILRAEALEVYVPELQKADGIAIGTGTRFLSAPQLTHVKAVSIGRDMPMLIAQAALTGNDIPLRIDCPYIQQHPEIIGDNIPIDVEYKKD